MLAAVGFEGATGPMAGVEDRGPDAAEEPSTTEFTIPAVAVIPFVSKSAGGGREVHY